VDHVLAGRDLPSWLAPAVRVVPFADGPKGQIGWAVGATLFIFVLDWACSLATKYANVTLGQRITQEIAGDLLRRLQQLSLQFHARRSTGDSIRRVTSDCGSIAVIIRDAILPVFGAVVTLVFMLIIMSRLSPTLTMVAVLAMPCMGLVFHLYAQQMLDRSYRQYDAEAGIYTVVEQTFSTFPAVKAFGRELLNESLLRTAAADTVRAALSLVSVQLQFKILVGLVTALGTSAIIWIGGLAAMRGEASIGIIVLFLSYLAALYTPLEAIMYTGSTIQTAGGGARRVFEILQNEPQVIDRANAITMPRLRGRVRFDNVHFAYDDTLPLLRGVSLDVDVGETVALVGETGAGKSSLVSLIPRFIDPTAGRVLIDEHDVREVQLRDLRRQIAIVSQDPFLFPLTIAENIAYGRPSASRSEIESAARAASADHFISRLSDGYDTVVGERGATLSGGERQRISIARALLMDARILILDEPTSALDVETERAVVGALNEVLAGRTTFVIAHRLSTVRRADRIVVLQNGTILEVGSHDQLVESGGVYSRLVQLQAHTQQI
jgi:ATP-binding cassette subfamily B protein/subfamily B ATP-binding cassette protein MsbA